MKVFDGFWTCAFVVRIESSTFFNWHPFLLSLAYPVAMTFGTLAFRRAATESDRTRDSTTGLLKRVDKDEKDRPMRKNVHASFMFFVSFLAVIGGFVIYLVKEKNGRM